MSDKNLALRAWAPRVIVISVVGGLWALSQYPTVTAHQREALASRFRFVREPLPEAEGYPRQEIRAVHPEVAHVEAWMSSMGASVALADLDGDGLANDLCHIDTRTDTVMVAPAPGTGARYRPLVLDPAPLPFARDSMSPLVCVPSDMNEDGRVDLLVTFWGRSPIAYFRRDDGGYVAREVVEPYQVWSTGATATADLDGDGHVDLLIGNYFPDGMPLLDEHSQEPLGDLQTSMSRAYNGGYTHLLRWTGATAGAEPSARWEDLTAALPEEVARGWTLAIGARDLDGDLLPEVYLAHDFGPDRLLHNRSTPGKLEFALLEGTRRFSSARSKVLGRDSFKGMGVDFGDLDGDGLTDMFVSNLTSEALQENHFAWIATGEPIRDGRAPFIDRGDEMGVAHSGWAWDAKIADFDNDGSNELVQSVGFWRGGTSRWPELEELAMQNDGLMRVATTWPRFAKEDDLSGREVMPFYVRDGERFVDIHRELGLDQPQVTRGIAVADVDGDGDLDWAVANQWDTSWMVRNECPDCGAFLGLHLRLPLQPAPMAVKDGHPTAGDTSTRPAIGAQAMLELPDGRCMQAEVDGGNGHSGKRSPDLHFGLGETAADARLPVTLRWRDPAGKKHEKTVELAPGWHTVELEWSR